MRVAIFDGSGADDEAAAVVNGEVGQAIEARGWAAQPLVLREMHIPPCLGCFECWVHTPGRCIAGGDSETVARTYIGSNAVVLLTRVTFGGYSSHLKKALDHCIGLVSPTFSVIDGETHHKKRYGRYPSLVAIGLQRDADADARDIFQTLVARNAINIHAPSHRVVVVAGPPDPAAVRMEIDAALEAIGGGQ